MNTQPDLERCLAFLQAQARPTGVPHADVDDAEVGRAVTISRQAGCGALVVGQSLADYLQSRARKSTRPWTLFDRNLVEQVLDDHNLPKRLAKFMPEDRIPEIADTIEDLFGLHPPSWVLVRKTAQTILHLAQLGHVILIGRGANIITRRLAHVFHVRLVGSVEKRRSTSVSSIIWTRDPRWSSSTAKIAAGRATSKSTSTPILTTRCSITW